MTLVDEVRAVRSLPSPSMRRAIREAAGVSQKRLARELGVSNTTVSRWEAGESTPSPAYGRLLRDLAEEVQP